MTLLIALIQVFLLSGSVGSKYNFFPGVLEVLLVQKVTQQLLGIFYFNNNLYKCSQMHCFSATPLACFQPIQNGSLLQRARLYRSRDFPTRRMSIKALKGSFHFRFLFLTHFLAPSPDFYYIWTLKSYFINISDFLNFVLYKKILKNISCYHLNNSHLHWYPINIIFTMFYNYM